VKPWLLRTATIGAIAPLLALSVGHAAPPERAARRTRTELKTPLHGLVPGEVLVIRAAEARPDAPPSRIDVVFLDETDRVVRRDSQEIRPGQAGKFQLAQEELGTGLLFPSVRVEVFVNREGRGCGNQVFLSAESLDVNRLVARGGWSCGPPQRPGTQFACADPCGFCCDGGVVATNVVTTPGQ
jgi:hypothetical protein